ncbi:MAG: cytochrome C oxidase subunit IV family protein [Pirellulales bacterium]|nr:cytochrome C oxidase subunit IV family protein [Pirellulales bacterium]
MSESSHDGPHGSSDHHESHGSIGLYLSIFVALCVLTSFSFLTYFPFWRSSVPVGVSRAFMMAVSCTKAMLVIMFFMHLKWEANWKWVLTVPASFMSALLIFALVPDVGLRMRHASHDRMIYAAEVPANEGATLEGSGDDHLHDAQEHLQETPGQSQETHEHDEEVRPAA